MCCTPTSRESFWKRKRVNKLLSCWVIRRYDDVLTMARHHYPILTYPSDSCKAAILQNHGILVATDSVEATVFFYMALENACRVQLLADAAAAGRGTTPNKIQPEDAYATYQTIGTLSSGWFQAQPEFQLLEAREGLKFDLSKAI